MINSGEGEPAGTNAPERDAGAMLDDIVAGYQKLAQMGDTRLADSMVEYVRDTSPAIMADMLGAAVRRLAELRAEVDRLMCPSTYPECPASDRRCVLAREHGTADLHFNKAGFVWSDRDAKKSAARAAAARP